MSISGLVETCMRCAITLFLLFLASNPGCKNQDLVPLPLNQVDQGIGIPFEEVDSAGLDLEKITAQRVVFIDNESWKMFWAKYGEGTVPQIDFADHMVVGVFLGIKPNPGYGVEITKIQKSGIEILIHVIEYIPNPKYDYPSVIAFPHHIVSFPRTEGEVVFTVEQKIRD